MTIWVPEKLEPRKSKYEAIALAIGEDIASGKLTPGEKLPTQRELSRELAVTIGTIGRAYALAEKRGLISLEIGRGSFVRSFGSQHDHLDHRPGTIDLGLNLPPVTEQGDLFSRTLAQITNSRDIVTLFGCAPIESFEQHRVAAANWLSERTKCGPDDVLICNGTQNAIVSTLATLTKPGDSVMVEELTFPGMIAAAKLLHLKLVPVRMDDGGLIPAELERSSKQSNVLYCIPTNQNPTTRTMSRARRREIAKIAVANDLRIIEDDVYGRLIKNAPPPISQFASEQTFLISSLAKTLSVGIRLAFVRVPTAYRELMIANLRASNFFPSPLLCEIAARWIADGTAEHLLREQQEIGERRRNIAAGILDRRMFEFKAGGNHLWMNLPIAWSSTTLQRAAKENGVNIFTGDSFAAPGFSAPNAVRIALGAARNDSELQIGLKVIARLLADGKSHATATY